MNKIKVQEFLKKNLDSLGQALSRLPSASQWKMFFKVLEKKEKIAFLSCLVCFFATFTFFVARLWTQNTMTIPSFGGMHIEGMIGQPRFINPVLQFSEVDRSLTEILFAGLIKYEKNGQIVPDLAQEYNVSENGTLYEVILRENIFWHDGQEITSDDVLFTIKTIQDAEFKSPEMANWVDVKVQKISDKKITFKLKNSYFPFLERLTIKILPEHIFGEITPESFPLVIYNLEPIGSGPFRFQSIKYNKLGEIESLDLIRNQDYFGKPPYLEKVRFLFFETEQELTRAIRAGEIKGFSFTNPETASSFINKSFTLHQISFPRYFSVFYNEEKSEILGEKKVREALELGINKKEIIEKAIKNLGEVVASPLLPEVYGFKKPEEVSAPNQEKARSLLRESGFVEKNGKFFEVERESGFSFTSKLKKGSEGKEVEDLQTCLSFFNDVYPEGKITGYFGDATEQAVILFQEKYRQEILDPWDFEEGTGIVAETTREKLNQVCNEFSAETSPLTFSLVTVSQPFLIETAKALREQWQELGIELEIKALEFNKLTREFIKPREYEMLLFGEALAIIPDPLTFWHSSRIDDPGLNLAVYENKDADEFLKKAREAQNFEEFRENLEKFQEVLLQDSPAIFLYRPHFLYFISHQIKGTEFEIISEPSKRFIDIENWYVKTQRVFR